MNEVTGETSDGYHTFNELYEHRHALFLLVMRAAWINKVPTWVEGDPSTEGWFLAGVDTSYGQISYHLPNKYLPDALRYTTIGYKREPYDGYTSADVLDRLQAWVSDWV